MKRNLFSFFLFVCVAVTASTSIRAQDYLVDTSFNPTFGGQTHSVYQFNNVVVVQPDQKILVGGNFTTVNDASSPLIVRLNADGSRDTTFNSPLGAVANDAVRTIKLLPDGRMLVAGVFRISNIAKYFVRLNSDGSLDTSFSSLFVGGIRDVEFYEDGRFMACGSYAADGVPFMLARFFQDGVRDYSFQVNLTGVSCVDVEILPDGKIFAGGRIAGMDGFSVPGLIKLNSDGSKDTSFNLPYDGNNVLLKEFFRLKLQPNGELLGSYRSETIDSSWSGLVRLGSTGALQSFSDCLSYGTSPTEFIYLQDDGRIVTSGCRSQNSPPYSYSFARLHPDGRFDTALNLINFNGSTPRNIDRQADGKYLLVGYFNTVNGIPRQRIVRLSQNLESARRRFDFDGDGKSDISVFRPSTGVWYISNSSNNAFRSVQFGLANDKLAPADFDGDGKTDISVFRNGTWYFLTSSNNLQTTAQFGTVGDLPVPGDFDADGKADISVFRPSNGTWYRLNSSTNEFVAHNFGLSEDLPQIADFDGDGKSDLAVFRPSSSVWYTLLSTNNSFFAFKFGLPEDIPSPADYDGDGKTDISVFRPSSGIWYRINSSNNSFFAQHFGLTGDIPTAADFDGDGKADLAVFRQGIWYLQQTTAGFAVQQFGINSDIPLPSVFGQ